MSVSNELLPDECSTPVTGSEPFSRRDVVPIVLTCVVWTLLAFVIDPRGDFPLMDDWAYGLPARAILERGEIRLTDWANPSLIMQALWGALFCLPVGFSFTTLRISTLVAGLIGLIATYGLMRQIGARRSVALFATWTVGANPVFICSSFSFMTDTPFICLLTVSAFLLVRGLARDSDGAILLGLGAAFASVFIRQIGVAIFMGFVVAYPFRRGLGRRWFLQALLPAVLAFVALKAYERGLLSLERLPRFYSKFTDSTAEFFSRLARGKIGLFKVVLAKLWDLLLFLGTYTLPFSLLCWPSRLAWLSYRRRLLELGCVLGLTIIVTITLAMARAEPRSGFIVYNFGVGPRFLTPEMMAGQPGHLPFVPSLGLRAISALGAVLLLQALLQVGRRILSRPRSLAEAASGSCVVFLIATCTFYMGPTIASFVTVWDRYPLAILALVLALIWEGHATGREGLGVPQALDLHPIGVGLGLVGLMLTLAFATAGTHDYLDWSRVRWNTVLGLAAERDIPATDIDGGWEYNNYIANLDRLYKSYQERESLMAPEEREGNTWGESLDRRYRVSPHLATGYESIRKVPLSPWLPLAPREFIVSKRIDP